MSVINFEELKQHVGHDIVCVVYGLRNRIGEIIDYENATIECEDCNEVLLSFDRDEEEG